MTLGPARILPMATYVLPMAACILPMVTCVPPVENQPEVTLGALFHGYFHVLREVP